MLRVLSDGPVQVVATPGEWLRVRVVVATTNTMFRVDLPFQVHGSAATGAGGRGQGSPATGTGDRGRGVLPQGRGQGHGSAATGAGDKTQEVVVVVAVWEGQE